MVWSVIQFLDFTLRTLAALPSALTKRFRDVMDQLDRVFLASLPIVIAAGLSIGLVTWLQTRRQLASFGLEANLPSILMVAVVLETGPILAGLLLAGRMGAGLAAELGSMALTEQLDAREVLGARVEPTIVAPRVLACLVSAPFLTVVLDVTAFGGALIAELAYGDMSAMAFGARALDFLKLEDILPATLKTACFGFLIGVIGCWYGCQARNHQSTEAVGLASTRGVVAAMMAVLISNLILTPYLQVMGDLPGWLSAWMAKSAY